MSPKFRTYRPRGSMRGHDRISHLSRWIVGILLYIVAAPYVWSNISSSNDSSVISVQIDSRRLTTSGNSLKHLRLLPEEQSLGRGAVAGGDNKERDKNHDDQQHVTSYSQRHPNYYYTNGNRVSNSNTKSAYSYYDYNDDDDRYYNKIGQRNNIYNYTTKLSDVYWCLLIALGWTIWMIHSIASLRQQHYNTMLSLSERGLNDTTMMPTPNADTMRIFRTNYKSLLLVRGHVLDIIPKAIIATDTPFVKASTCTVVIDYVVERQQQPLLSPTATATTGTPDDDNNVTTLPTIDVDNVPPNEFIQIRKHFETSQANLEVGFGNVELLVLPNDPMCSILKYDYEEYVRQEERIQRVIVLEQHNRSQRRKKRQQRRLQKSSSPILENATQRPIVIESENEETLMPPNVTRPPLHIETNLTDTEHLEKNAIRNDNDDDDDDDMFSCDICCTYCDWNYDQYQWKRLSLFFAVLLVLASIIGTLHVVRRMDPPKKYLGWISFWIGIVFLFPTALWIHRIIIACQRWSESEPEKQGFIVQSSTITSFNNCSGELEPNNVTNPKHATNMIPTTTAPNQPSMMTLADACMRPSCANLMDDICDPHCSNHTWTNPQNTSKSRTTQTEFSYVVPEMSGCYFIHYPKKDHYHHHHHRSNSTRTKHVRKSKQNQQAVDGKSSVPVLEVLVEHENMVDSKGIEGSGMPSDGDPPTVLNASQRQQLLGSASPSTTSSIMESESSVSSLSSNDDPTMKQLSIWNSMIHDI